MPHGWRHIGAQYATPAVATEVTNHPATGKPSGYHDTLSV
jgi:hypothetical protein